MCTTVVFAHGGRHDRYTLGMNFLVGLVLLYDTIGYFAPVKMLVMIMAFFRRWPLTGAYMITRAPATYLVQWHQMLHVA